MPQQKDTEAANQTATEAVLNFDSINFSGRPPAAQVEDSGLEDKQASPAGTNLADKLKAKLANEQVLSS